MGKKSWDTDQVQQFILQNLEVHPKDIVAITAGEFRISRQAVHRHLQKLMSEGVVALEGRTRARVYKLRPLLEWHKTIPLKNSLAEDAIWRQDVLPLLSELPKNVTEIWHYGFTEMMNNAVDHSDGSAASIAIEKSYLATKLTLFDDGVGIFRKIKENFTLADEREAVLELVKGKLTTDPEHHTGEGIFFTSRVFDEFQILSGSFHFSHVYGEETDWVFDSSEPRDGTLILLRLSNSTPRTLKATFDRFTNEHAFSRTIVPVSLAQYGEENLISRSQAKRLVSRIDRFREVTLDFKGVAAIGQAFADEVFRVFQNAHPEVSIVTVNASKDVMAMIERAKVAQ